MEVIKIEELLILDEQLVFDVEKVKRGSFVRAHSTTWNEDEWRNGLVVHAAKDKLKVLCMMGTTSAAINYFTISLADVKNGLWSLLISENLEEVYAHGPDTQETGDEPAP